jgi:hypothetical protein
MMTRTNTSINMQQKTKVRAREGGFWVFCFVVGPSFYVYAKPNFFFYHKENLVISYKLSTI